MHNFTKNRLNDEGMLSFLSRVFDKTSALHKYVKNKPLFHTVFVNKLLDVFCSRIKQIHFTDFKCFSVLIHRVITYCLSSLTFISHNLYNIIRPSVKTI